MAHLIRMPHAEAARGLQLRRSPLRRPPGPPLPCLAGEATDEKVSRPEHHARVRLRPHTLTHLHATSRGSERSLI